MKRIFLLGILVVTGVSGCDWIKSPSSDNLQPPTELTEFASKVNLTKLWTSSVGEGEGTAGLRLRPAFEGGKIYASDASGSVAAFAADTGKQVWRVQLDQAASSGPSVRDGLLAVAGIDGAVVALDAGSGQQRWRALVSSEVLAAPAIGDGIVVVRAQDGRVFGFDANDGARKWVFDRSVPLLSLRGNSPPLINDGVVYVAFDGGKIAALTLANGALRWEQTLAVSEGRTELERMVDIDGELSLSGDEIFVVSYRGKVGALLADSGRVRWSRDLSAYGGVSSSGDRLYVADADGTVQALDARGGASLWKQDGLKHRWLGTPVAVGDYVVVGDFEGYLHVLSAEDGSFAARTRLGDEGLRTTPLVVGNAVYATSADGSLGAWRVGG